MFMLKWAFYVVSWVCCVALFGLIVGRPEDLALLLRGWGAPATAVDIVFTDRSVLWVCGLCVLCMFGYAIPRFVSRLLRLISLRGIATDIAIAKHEHRTFMQLEDLVQQSDEVLGALSPVSNWAYDSSSENGDTQIAAKRFPSSILSAEQLKRGGGWLSGASFLPQFLLMAAAIIVLLSLSRSADEAFAEVLSVVNTDYGTMILGIRSATAALAVALFTALLIWLADKLLDHSMQMYSEVITTGLDQLVVLEDGSAMDLPMPIAGPAPTGTTQYDMALSAMQKKLTDIDASLKKLNTPTTSDTVVASLQAAINSSTARQEMILGGLQQSMDELQALRQDVDTLHESAMQPLPVLSPVNPATDKLTSAIRALKDSAEIDLPRL